MEDLKFRRRSSGRSVSFAGNPFPPFARVPARNRTVESDSRGVRRAALNQKLGDASKPPVDRLARKKIEGFDLVGVSGRDEERR